MAPVRAAVALADEPSQRLLPPRPGRGMGWYVVARRNDVRLPRPDALSPRERQALGFAVLGDSNKLIAYELGISASTVGVLLHRAAQKLGCHSRVELLRRFQELLAAPPNPPKPSTH